MKLGLQLRLKQTLAPQLIQSLRLLQMPALQLEQTLRTELVTNPLLEELDSFDDVPEKPDDYESPAPEAPVAEKPKETVDWEEYLGDDDNSGYKVRDLSGNGDEESSFESYTTKAPSLYEHLKEQLSCLKLHEDDHLIAEYVIGNISPDGYLTISPAEMAAELSVSEAHIVPVLEQIQRFDPTGVGARDLRESLLIQLKDRGQERTLAWRIVHEYLGELEKKSITQLAKMLDVQPERMQKALETIRTLSPTPAAGRFDQGAMAVVPDLIVDRFGEEYLVFHNDKNIPRLRINGAYKDLIKRGGSATEDTKNYVRQKLEQARWLLNAINQRRGTMVRVMESIVEEQKEFFEKGPAFLKPLIMEDIARKVNMNVATISRVSNGKYVQTPLGVYEIKYFFNTGIAREDGDDLSKRTVKQRIEDIIKDEDGDLPFSDQEIYKRLATEGIKLARRTVTKYREELGIKPARFRKKIGAGV